eukprot:361177-Chlamydomonas_euryale.AAC.7
MQDTALAAHRFCNTRCGDKRTSQNGRHPAAAATRLNPNDGRLHKPRRSERPRAAIASRPRGSAAGYCADSRADTGPTLTWAKKKEREEQIEQQIHKTAILGHDCRSFREEEV